MFIGYINVDSVQPLYPHITKTRASQSSRFRNMQSSLLLFCLLVEHLLTAPFAKLLKLKLALNSLAVFSCPVI